MGKVVQKADKPDGAVRYFTIFVKIHFTHSQFLTLGFFRQHARRTSCPNRRVIFTVGDDLSRTGAQRSNCKHFIYHAAFPIADDA